jgi:DNA-binding NtrC family response regulator
MQNIIILTRPKNAGVDNPFGAVFKSTGEFIYEISELYSALKERFVELILIDSSFPGLTAGIIRRIRIRSPLADIWKITPSASVMPHPEDSYDGVLFLIDGETEIAKKINKILTQKALLKRYGLVGHSEKLKMIAETISRISATDVSVLIAGPSGSGKEVIARAVHDNSNRAKNRFVAVNCGAIAEGVLESELFGHERGAFTGSVGKREGLFVQANGGTIFLDEIGETKPDTQVKLLRVLEDGVFYPVGGDRPVHSDARIIAATNRDLSEAIRDGEFREDLYFRLGVVMINVPSLYDRKEDILPLLYHFAAKEKLKGFSDGAVDILLRYDWPGNVRQLRNFVAGMGALHPGIEISSTEVERFISEQGMSQRNLPVTTGRTPDEAGHELIYRALLSLGGEVKMLRDLIISNLPSRPEMNSDAGYTAPGGEMSEGAMQGMEKELIEKILQEAGGNRRTAARRLGIGERTLYRKLKKYNLN